MATRYGSRAQLEANLRQHYGVDKWDQLPGDIRTSLVDQYARPMNLPSDLDEEVSSYHQDLRRQMQQFGTPRALGFSAVAGANSTINLATRMATGVPTYSDAQIQYLRESAPVSAGVGEFAGSFFDPVFLAIGGGISRGVAGPLLRSGAEGGNLAARLGGYAGIGGVTMAGIGALEGFASPPEGMTRLQGAVEGVKSGFGQGAVGGLALGGAGEALGAGLSALRGKRQGVPNAIQEPSTTQVDVRQPTGDGPPLGQALQTQVAPEARAPQVTLTEFPRSQLNELESTYGIKIRVGGGEYGGEAGPNYIHIGTNETPIKARAGNWLGSGDFVSTNEYPANQATAAHEIAHVLFSRDPQAGHKALEKLVAAGVRKDVAFENLVDLGGLYILEPDAITDQTQRAIIGEWLGTRAKSKATVTAPTAEAMPLPPNAADLRADNAAGRKGLVAQLVKQGMDEVEAVKLVGPEPPERQYPIERGLQQARAASGQPLVEPTVTEPDALKASIKAQQRAGRTGVEHGREAVDVKTRIDAQELHKIPTDLVPTDMDQATINAQAENWRRKVLTMNTLLDKNGRVAPLDAEQAVLLERSNASHPAMLSPDLMEAVDNTARAYEAMVKQQRQLIGFEKALSATDAAIGMVQDIADVKVRKPSRLGPTVDRAVDAIRAVFDDAMTPMRELIRQRSPTLHRLYVEEMASKGRNTALSLQQDANESMHRVMQQFGQEYKSTKTRNWAMAPVQIETTEGPVTVSREYRMALRAHLNDPDQRNLARRGMGFSIGEGRDKRVITFSPQNINDLWTKMPKDELAMVMEAVRQFNQGKLREAADRAIEQNIGFRKLLRAGYWMGPKDRALADTGKGTGTLHQVFGRQAMENAGILISREGGNTPIRVNPFFNEWEQHVNMLSRIAGYMNPLRNLEVVLGSAHVKENYARRFGAGFIESVLNNAREEAMGRGMSRDFDSAVRGLTSKAALSMLKLNIGSAFVQPASLFITLADTNPKYIAAALRAPFESKTIRRIANRFSPQYKNRYEDFSRPASAGTILNASRSPIGPRNDPKFLKWMDEIVGDVRWMIAEAEVRDKNRGLRYRSDEFNEKVARVWERMTNVSDNTAYPMENARLIAAGANNPMVGMYTMFASAPSKVYGMARRAANEAAKGNYKSAAKIATMVALGAYYEAMVRRGLNVALYGKDDAKSVNMGAAQNLIASMPVVGNIANTMIDKVAGEQAFEFGRTPLDRGVNSGINAAANMYKMIDGSDDEAAYKTFRAALDVYSLISGHPIGNIERLYTGITKDR